MAKPSPAAWYNPAIRHSAGDGPDRSGKHLLINAAYVRQRLGDILQKEDLSKLIL